MAWNAKLEKYECKDCGQKYDYMKDTMFMARNPHQRPKQCPNCSGSNCEKVEEMEETFVAFMKWSTTKVGDNIKTTDGRILRITAIDRVEWHGDVKISIHGLGIPTNE